MWIDVLNSMINPVVESFTCWQDIVIAVIGLLFGFFLIPQLRDVWKKGEILNIYTAALTTLGLFVLAVTFFTMKFWVTFIADLFSGTIWFLLFLLSFLNKRKV